MKPEYLKRVRRFSNLFIQDVLDTMSRINQKDGKAYPLRIQKSVSKRWAHVPRYKVTLTLNYLEYMGLVKCRLEPVEEYKERMKNFPGLNKKGLRRKYFYMNPDKPSLSAGTETDYTKLRYNDLGIDYEQIEDYPV